VLSDKVIRFGKANEEQIQLERKDADVSLTLSGGKRKGMAVIATLHGNPAMALVDSKNVNQVHIEPAADDTSIGILCAEANIFGQRSLSISRRKRNCLLKHDSHR
jgi:ABC-type lipopolysaccharide export system ATPase subunit